MRRVSNTTAIALSVAAIILLSGCVQQVRKQPPQLSQLQVRELQTKFFPQETVVARMKAVSAALQDEGYSIDSANTELGLITGNRTINDLDETTRNAQVFWMGFAKDYRAARSWTATANIARIDDKLRVRISLVEKELNEAGGIIYSQPVIEQAPYQALFSKIDKSVFLQKNKL